MSEYIVETPAEKHKSTKQLAHRQFQLTRDHLSGLPNNPQSTDWAPKMENIKVPVTQKRNIQLSRIQYQLSRACYQQSRSRLRSRSQPVQHDNHPMSKVS